MLLIALLVFLAVFWFFCSILVMAICIGEQLPFSSWRIGLYTVLGPIGLYLIKRWDSQLESPLDNLYKNRPVQK